MSLVNFSNASFRYLTDKERGNLFRTKCTESCADNVSSDWFRAVRAVLRLNRKRYIFPLQNRYRYRSIISRVVQTQLKMMF